MTVKEEYVYFEYELSRLSEEYVNCLNLSLKQQIQEDIQLLEIAVEMVKKQTT